MIKMDDLRFPVGLAEAVAGWIVLKFVVVALASMTLYFRSEERPALRFTWC